MKQHSLYRMGHHAHVLMEFDVPPRRHFVWRTLTLPLVQNFNWPPRELPPWHYKHYETAPQGDPWETGVHWLDASIVEDMYVCALACRH